MVLFRPIMHLGESSAQWKTTNRHGPHVHERRLEPFHAIQFSWAAVW
jgi:hypothetical protein